MSLHSTLDDGYASLALRYDLGLDRWSILLLLVLLAILKLEIWNPLAIRSYLPHLTALLGRSLGFYSIVYIDTHDCITRT